MDDSGAATTRDAPPVTPPRTWRPMLWWTLGILAALTPAWFVGAVVVPVIQTDAVLADVFGSYQSIPASKWQGSPDHIALALKRLGGSKSAPERLCQYYRWRWFDERNSDSVANCAEGYRKGVAVVLLGYCDRVELGTLVRASRDPDLSIRLAAISSLRRIASGTPEAVSILEAFSRDYDQCVRFAAAEALGEIGPSAKDAVPAIEKLLKDESEYVRAAAAEALKKIRGQEPGK